MLLGRIRMHKWMKGCMEFANSGGKLNKAFKLNLWELVQTVLSKLFQL
jgi:hypothetical protein